MGASRLLRALAQRTWGAAEVCRNAQLMERLGDPRSETTAQEWRFAIVQVLPLSCSEICCTLCVVLLSCLKHKDQKNATYMRHDHLSSTAKVWQRQKQKGWHAGPGEDCA